MSNRVVENYFEQFAAHPEILIKAPGRINLIGEHTDYNDGYVLPAAIDKHISFAVAKTKTGFCRLHALDLNESFEFEFNNVQKTEKVWVNYLMGIIYLLQKRGVHFEGINCVFGGNIPIGSGMSSSAALECGFAFALNELHNLGLDRMEIARIGRQSENEFMGIQSGILDQFSSLFGKQDHAIFMDCQTLDYEYIPLNLGSYQLVLINTMQKHQNLDSGYNDRPTECKKAVEILQSQFPEVTSLRLANKEMLSLLDKHPVLQNRATFMLAENERVTQSCDYLKKGKIVEFGALMYETHHGLSQLYEVSCKELDLLVQLTQSETEVIGARMMGGGFGGCTLNLVHQSNSVQIIDNICQKYQSETGIKPEVYWVKIEDGVNKMN